jgi:hypothetical protein
MHGEGTWNLHKRNESSLIMLVSNGHNIHYARSGHFFVRAYVNGRGVLQMQKRNLTRKKMRIVDMVGMHHEYIWFWDPAQWHKAESPIRSELNEKGMSSVSRTKGYNPMWDVPSEL